MFSEWSPTSTQRGRSPDLVFWSGGESSFQMCHLRITNHNEDGFDVKIESFPKESVHLATLEAIQNKENTDFFLWGSHLLIQIRGTPSSTVGTGVKQVHDVLLAPKSIQLSYVSLVLKMNKLSTHNLCTSNCPGFTGCALHATYKYLPSFISQGLTATTASGFSSLLPVPSSCLQSPSCCCHDNWSE